MIKFLKNRNSLDFEEQQYYFFLLMFLVNLGIVFFFLLMTFKANDELFPIGFSGMVLIVISSVVAAETMVARKDKVDNELTQKSQKKESYLAKGTIYQKNYAQFEQEQNGHSSHINELNSNIKNSYNDKKENKSTRVNSKEEALDMLLDRVL
ncbi:TPA: hypothetical protein ACQ0F8_001631 [Streptococcus agalactiae]|nr:hypothetical protein [Streptococcus agalactiae]HEO4177363.1 hypothetical protein [Streptococcus agalactiae]